MKSQLFLYKTCMNVGDIHFISGLFDSRCTSDHLNLPLHRNCALKHFLTFCSCFIFNNNNFFYIMRIEKACPLYIIRR